MINQSNNRWFIRLIKSLSLAALALVCSASIAWADLQAYEARYSLMRNGQQVGETRFRLQPVHGQWRWSMHSKPKGLFRWLTRKKPFAETWLAQTDLGWQPIIELTGDDPDRGARRATWIDHEQGRLYYASHKTQKQLAFSAPVYNYHSIHLLYRDMKDKGASERIIRFYRKGRIVDARVRLDTNVRLRTAAGPLQVDRLSQQLANSKRRMLYFYDGYDLAPRKIEQIDEDDNSVMWRQSYKTL